MVHAIEHEGFVRLRIARHFTSRAETGTTRLSQYRCRCFVVVVAFVIFAVAAFTMYNVFV